MAPRNPSAYNPGTKVFIGTVLVIGIGALFYGAYAIKQQIYSPFQFKLSGTPDFAAMAPASDEEEREKLKLEDTDRDGLMDYDEIYLFGTSRYLADSDSDGLTDIAEIKSGTDPNCKEGEDCTGIRLITPETKISDLFPQFSESTVTLKEKTLQQFREELQTLGYDKEKLAKIDDRMLLIILEEALKLQDEEAKGVPVDEREPLDLDEVRQFFINLGVPEDEVYSMSNKELEDMLKTFE